MLEDHPVWGAKCSRHGIDYQELWLILFLMRVMDKKCPFRLATELKSAAGFDDVVLQCKQKKQQYIGLCKSNTNKMELKKSV